MGGVRISAVQRKLRRLGSISPLCIRCHSARTLARCRVLCCIPSNTLARQWAGGRVKDCTHGQHRFGWKHNYSMDSTRRVERARLVIFNQNVFINLYRSVLANLYPRATNTNTLVNCNARGRSWTNKRVTSVVEKYRCKVISMER